MKVQTRAVPKVEHALDSFDPVIQKLLLSRGITKAEEVEFKLNRLIPLDSLKGATKAGQLLADAIEENKHILIIGDFDCDGATSTALSIRCLKAMGANKVSYLVPNRFEFGYGLSPEIVRESLTHQPDIIVTVDNGISNNDGVDEAACHGIPVIITDHHLPGELLPKAAAIVNPNQPGCTFPSKAMAGVGVAFYTMLALRKELRRRSWFERRNLSEPNMASYLDLVAVGTVADLVPLDANNRVLVAMGIQRIRAGKGIPGLYALLNVAKKNPSSLSTSDIGFGIGPRINAAGRLDDMSEGIECLLTDNYDKALSLAAHLDSLNAERKEIEQGMRQEAEMYVGEVLEEKPVTKGLVVYRDNWHEGVIGIVASRIKETFYLPVIAFADAGNAIKGSARSIPGLHMRDCLDLINKEAPGVILKFGGHAMAAGLSIDKTSYDEFVSSFEIVLDKHFGHVSFEQTLMTDGALNPKDLTLSRAELLLSKFPWGQGFPEPLFEGIFEVHSEKILKERHIKWVLMVEGTLIDAIYFNVPDLEQLHSHKFLRLCYRLGVNEFRGQRSLQLMIDYAEAYQP
jgi:single-stranded-DNA-specific exonuclease